MKNTPYLSRQRPMHVDDHIRIPEHPWTQTASQAASELEVVPDAVGRPVPTLQTPRSEPPLAVV